MAAISATRPAGIRWWQVILALVWAVAFVAGAYGLFQRITLGHTIANYGSYMPWGLWVAMYIYFIGLSAGAFLLSSLIYVGGVQRLERIGKLALFTAFITLVSGLLTIWLDLGHQERFWEVYTRPNPFSMMAWMVWLYTAYFLLLIFETYFAVRRHLPAWSRFPGVRGAVAVVLTLGRQKPLSEAEVARDNRIVKWLGGIGVPLAIAFHGGVGALFGTVLARELWHSSLYPIMFLTGALLSGGALLTGLVAFFWSERDAGWRDAVTLLGRVVLGLLAFDTVLEWAEYSIPMWYGVGSAYQQLLNVLFGPEWWVFWLVHIAVGVAIPAVLLLAAPRNPVAVGLAGWAVAVSFLAVRLNMAIPALVQPELQGLQWSYHDSRLVFNYMPTLFEWQVLLFVVTLGVGLLYLGSLVLPLGNRTAAVRYAALQSTSKEV
jgi:molybdopterin-containing oxidoreductase family membrane subunit